MYPPTHQEIPGAWEQAKVKSLLDKFKLSRETLENVILAMDKDFTQGLSDSPLIRAESPIKMIPTFVRALPDGSEVGDYFSLDLGGTNFRVLLVQIHNGEAKMSQCTYPLSKEVMTGTADMLFGYIAECLAKFAKEKLGEDTKKISTVGFTFSFPVDQTSLVSGNLIKWTKGYDVKGVVDNDVVKLFQEAVKKRDEIEVEQVALLNDTTGVLMSCAYGDPSVSIGIIFGTGSNACYMESLDRVHKWKPIEGDTSPDQVIINTEWGAFGDKGELNNLRTKYDLMLDSQSLYPNKQVFEKMISGMYLGEIVRQCLIGLIRDYALFRGRISEQLAKKNSFTTICISEFCNGKAKDVAEILVNLGYSNATLEDCSVVREICVAVSHRAARLSAAGLTAIVRRLKKDSVSVAIDGTLYKKHPTFKRFMHHTLEELAPTTDINLKLAEDGSGRGAAVVAAVAHRLNRPISTDCVET